jgi:GT2 family glycosyltransferase
MTKMNVTTNKTGFLKLLRQNFKKSLRSSRKLALKCSANPVVSIVVVNYNNPELIENCLRSLETNCTVRKEVIIVDNGSNAETIRFLQSVSNAKIIFNKTNEHFLRAANAGAKKASGKYLLFINTDCFVLKGAIESCIDKLDSSKKTAVVGAKVIGHDGKVQEAGSILWRDGLASSYGAGSDPSSQEVGFDREVDYVAGCFFLTTRKMFSRLSGFDAIFAPAYYEDTDYCFRAWKMGFKSVYNSSASVIHVRQGSAKSAAEPRRLVATNRKIFYKRHKEILKKRPHPSTEGYWRLRTFNQKKNILVIVSDLSSLSGKEINFINRLSAKRNQVSLFILKSPNLRQRRESGVSSYVEILFNDDLHYFFHLLNNRKGSLDSIWFIQPELKRIAKTLNQFKLEKTISFKKI